MDCGKVRPIEAFFKTRGGSGSSDRCRECVESRAVAHRAEKERERQERDIELIDVLSTGARVPSHLWKDYQLASRAPSPKPKVAPRSNRPQMVNCRGCGEAVAKIDLWEYRGGRSNYCKPCMKLRAVERECADCGETKLTWEFFEGLRAASPYCRDCRVKREIERQCPRCGMTKPKKEFGSSGWCRPCQTAAQRARREQARSR